MTISFDQLITFITISLSVLAAIGSAVAFFANRPNQKADALKTMSETIDHLSNRVAELETERGKDHQSIVKLESKNQKLEHLLTLCVIGLNELSAQLDNAGIKPTWIPTIELKQWTNQISK